MIDKSSVVYKADLVARFIANQHQSVQRDNGRPLLVSMQGPQGAGKSTLASKLVETLSSTHGLTCAVASLDGLKGIAQEYPSNKLLQGRGPPGTHDISLLSAVIARLRSGSPPSPAHPVDLPFFDKSQHDGFGDRSPDPIPLIDPVDIFILEGWSLGYTSIPDQSAEERWKQGKTAHQHPFQSITDLNRNLECFDQATKDAFDCHVAIKPLSYEYVYEWRLQQEHHMKAENGGKGMSDDQVRAFVDRYMPVYEVFGETKPSRPVLTLIFGENREVVEE